MRSHLSLRCYVRPTVLLALMTILLGSCKVNGFSSPSIGTTRRVAECVQHQHQLTQQMQAAEVPIRKYSSNLHAKKTDDKPDESKDDNNMWKTIQDKPGTLIFLPFVALFGIDLLLNIFFITKRSFEYIVLGKVPSTETWF